MAINMLETKNYEEFVESLSVIYDKILECFFFFFNFYGKCLLWIKIVYKIKKEEVIMGLDRLYDTLLQ